MSQVKLTDDERTILRSKSMTYKDAIKILEINSICSPKATEFKKAVEIAKTAIEKQIPKKPEYYGDGYSNGELVYDYAKCPECGKDDFEYDINNWGCKCCPDCGQALDWSDTE